jgi:hypothetical protein
MISPCILALSTAFFLPGLLCPVNTRLLSSALSTDLSVLSPGPSPLPLVQPHHSPARVSRYRHPRFALHPFQVPPKSGDTADVMARYDDYPPSSSLDSEPVRWDADRFSRERENRRRGPALAERPRPVEDDRFESRIRQGDRYGPPVRRPESYYEDDDLVRPPAPSVARDRRRRVADPPPPPRPGLLRRQSSLDTFDRIPSRKLDEYYSREYAPRAAPIQMPPTRRSPPRRERDYEEIRIAEPDFYGDEEYRDFFERERRPRSRSRSSSGSRLGARLVEEVNLERPYPRKGKTRLPRRLVHPRAIIELGYPFLEEVRTSLSAVAVVQWLTSCRVTWSFF